MSTRVSFHGPLVLTALIVAGSAAAQAPADVSYSISPVLHTESDLDGGGEAGFAGVLTTFGRSWTLDPQSSLGLRLRADYEDWSFDQVGGFGGAEPWGQLYRVGLSASYGVMTDGGWRLSLTPTVEYSGESGAEFSDALEYGATVSAARRINPDLTLGLGVGAFARIEENSLFPFLIIDWRITDRLRLSNPFLAGPAGPAGLEMSYALTPNWEAGIGASYRSYRHRLDQDGPFAGGVGENRYIPVYLRIGRDLSEGLKLSLYAGAATSATLRVEDANGNRLYEEDQDPAAMLGLSLIGRF